MTTNGKMCPFLAGGHYALGECVGDQCQMWCPEIEEIYSHKQNKHFRAGCGLMPKENREFTP